MIKPPDHPREQERLELLQRLEILDTPPEAVFDQITASLSREFDLPIALLSIVDRERQWFKSSVGLSLTQTPREESFCAHAILYQQILLVPDTLQDRRFSGNPLVTCENGIRFYAGAPVVSAAGLPIGTLCVVDTRPRTLSPAQLASLRRAADQVQQELARRETLVAAHRNVCSSHRALLQSESRFARVFEHAAIGMALVDEDGSFIKVNAALCDIVGYSADELQRLTFQHITHAEDLHADLALLRQLSSGEIDRYQIDKRYIRKDGGVVWANLTVALERDVDGGLPYYISCIKDIQARKETEDSMSALRADLSRRVEERTEDLRSANQMLVKTMTRQAESEQLLRLRDQEIRAVIDNAHDAYIGMNDAGVIIDWNKQAELTFGWTRDEAIGLRLDETIIPARMRRQHRDGMKRFMVDGASRMLGRRVELPAVRKDGSSLAVEVRVQAIQAGPRRMFSAFLHDISGRRQREEEMRAQRAQLKQIADLMPALISYLDTDFRYRFVNRAYLVLLGEDPESLIGQRVGKLAGGDDFENLQPYLLRVLAGESVSWEHQTMVADAPRFWLAKYTPDIVNGKVVGIHGMVVDITERKIGELARERDATIDELTGLLNRRGLFSRLQQSLEQVDIGGRAAGVLFLDLDNFKSVNDRHGHAFGDRLLKEVGQRLATLEGGAVARLGGDEFIVLVEDLEQPEQQVARLSSAISALIKRPIVLDGHSLHLAVSIGSSIRRPHSGLSAETLLTVADAAMYAQKGRRPMRLRARS
ncbi:PAS domain S-box protein [Hydrocarboniphaga sp.]|uniref:PAS domain S-box protein n=1 Tax=Hydrocarboniphaga sp. TaxID=2033016 RepID=UPI003D0DB4D0